MSTNWAAFIWGALGLILGAKLGALVHALYPIEYGSCEQNRIFQVIIAAFPGAMMGAQIPRWSRPLNKIRGARRGLFILLTTVILTLIAGALFGFAAVISEYLSAGVFAPDVALYLGAEAGLHVALWVCLTTMPMTTLILVFLHASICLFCGEVAAVDETK